MRFVCLLFVLLQSALGASCATTINQSMPPETYKGPLATQPLIESGDYWIYELGNSTKAKSARLFSDLHFPLWIGKTWRYEIGAHRPRQLPTSTDSRIPAWVECYVIAFNDVQVPAGSFGAFQCECQCHLFGGEGIYQEGCGVWTIWYVPEVKNVVKRKTESTLSSFELVDYKMSERILHERRRAEDEKSKVAQANKAEIPAKVAQTVPADGSENVPTSIKEIVIVFDQPMSGAWNLNCSPRFYPDAPSGRRCSEGGTHWRDDRTFVVQLTAGLKPNQRYSFGVNPSVGVEKYDLTRGFRGLGHSKPVVPQRFFFTTAP
jgi:hypothetical protein